MTDFILGQSQSGGWLTPSMKASAPLAQLDRASGFESEGRELEPLRARHKINQLQKFIKGKLRKERRFVAHIDRAPQASPTTASPSSHPSHAFTLSHRPPP